MLALFALGQHDALCAVQESLHPSEILMAFLDDLHVVSVPERIASVEQQVEVQFWRHSSSAQRRGPITYFEWCLLL